MNTTSKPSIKSSTRTSNTNNAISSGSVYRKTILKKNHGLSRKIIFSNNLQSILLILLILFELLILFILFIYNYLYLIIISERGVFKWTEIAIELNKLSVSNVIRAGKQCRERWNNHLDPNLNKGQWRQEEDDQLMKLIHQYGKKWSVISKKQILIINLFNIIILFYF